jgi:hypothetical protein
MASDPQKQRDIASGRDDRAIATATAEVPASPAGGTGAAAGGWDTAANRDIAITAINTNRTRIGEIIDALERQGILINA